jgi:membrane protein implicated in regulation of membrane protease activity
VSLGDAALNTKAATQGGPIGLFMAFLFLIGGAFALALLFVSVLAFFFAGIFGIAGGASTSFGDLTVWGVASLILAVFSYFGWREKRKRREEAARVVQ